ncbi:MAG: alpha-amylase [Gemmatimonadetes bacterium]|nr:alpha-amylase [Gemmatimonadota bacterium]
MTPPLIYNLFPRLVGPLSRWPEHAERAQVMGFNWLYVNPWHYPGFSGSLYAPKELERINPIFLPPGADDRDLGPLRDFLGRMNGMDLPVMMDLVINHTSKDSPLIEQHPEWFVRDESGEVVSPFVCDPDDPEKVTVWGDLAEVDNWSAAKNETSADREALWDFWAELVRDSLELGFRGFRCDAAYKVPAALWRRLIEEAREVDAGVQFFAETLGAPVDDVVALKEAGFDYFFNSSKWWNLSEQWALDQHEEFRGIAPSIAFPESHDTPRLAAESGGREQVQRQRYALAAAFSAGVMMPIGYEFGFRKQVNVVHTQPSDWERRGWDLRRFVTRVNELKLREPWLQGEGVLRARQGLKGDVLVLERTGGNGEGSRGWIVINKVWDEPRDVRLPEAMAGGGYRVVRVMRDGASAEAEPPPGSLRLDPAEVVYVLPTA